jgi:two-component system, OmpR family, sensor kinase
MTGRLLGTGLGRRLQLAVLASTVLVLAALLAGFNLVLRERLSDDADNALFARSTAQLAALRVAGGRLVVPEVHDAAATDGQTWVFSANRALEHPVAPSATEHAAQSLSGGGRRHAEVPATHTRLYAVPVVIGGRRLGTVVAAVSLRPYERTAHTALVASLVLGGLVLVAVAIGARLVIAAALKPVARMTERANEWSASDLERRFDLGAPRDELRQLAATLDGLLDRVAGSLRHEQRFSAELSHELRTPLALVVAEAQYTLRHARTPEEHRAGFSRILEAAVQMRRTLDALLDAARAEAEPGRRGTGDAAAAARAAARGCTRVAEEEGIEVEVRLPSRPVRVGVATDLAERVLAPLVENGCRYGAGAVEISVERRGGSVLFTVADDGRGVAAEERELIFEPGRRGAGSERDGAGLGLALARRLARAVGGDVVAEAAARGASFTARLPAA